MRISYRKEISLPGERKLVKVKMVKQIRTALKIHLFLVQIAYRPNLHVVCSVNVATFSEVKTRIKLSVTLQPLVYSLLHEELHCYLKCKSKNKCHLAAHL